MTDVPHLSVPVHPAPHVRLRPGQKVRLAVEIVGAYIVLRWQLVRAGLPETVGAARIVADPSVVATEDTALVVARRLGAAVERTLGAMPFDSRCLIRSLVLVRILARRGIESALVLGVSTKPTFAAHAWVEHAGIPVLPTGARFQRIAEM